MTTDGEDEIRRQVEEAARAAEAKRRGAGGKGKPQRRKGKASPFKTEDGRIWREVETQGPDGETRRAWIPFGSELHILARTRNGEGEDHGRLLEVVDRDGVRHHWAMPASLLAGTGEAIRAELLRLGWTPASGAGRKWRDWLLEYLITAEPEERVRCVSGIGWHGAAFVLPDEVIGGDGWGERVILQSAERLEHAFHVAGSLEDWQGEGAGRALGNSRLMLAISAAFAAPLLAATGDEGGGFHLRGASSSGKSTALAVAGSVWGGGGTRGYGESWRSTDNGLEGLAALHNGALLTLDELSQIDPRAAGQAAYMLGNGRGKARAGREGQVRKAHEWRLLFLSNGEVGLEDKIAEGGGRIAAGMQVRVIDLRADAGAGLGLFEDLHGAVNAASFAQALKAAASKVYGAPARVFLRPVTTDLPGIRQGVARLRQGFVAAAVPAGADGQVRRVADRFSLVAAAGELASDLGVTGWPPGAAATAALRCFRDWLSERGGIGSSEVADARARLRRTVEVDGHGRFLPWDPDSRTVVRLNALKYRRQPDEAMTNDPPTFFIHASGMAELLAGLDRKTVLEEMADEGVIVRHEVMAKGEKVLALTRVFKVPSEKSARRLYQLDHSALMREPGDGDG